MHVSGLFSDFWFLIYYILLGRIFTVAQRERTQEDFKVLYEGAPEVLII